MPRTCNRPDIVLLTSHDTGHWLQCNDCPTVASPNLDALASDGFRFSNAFCTSPICSPSRGAMMTGRYPQQNGLMGLIQNPYRWRLNPTERHASHLLAEIGYHTVLFNHQHEAPHDAKLGFQDFRRVNQGAHLLPMLNDHVSRADETADAFAAFLDERRDAADPYYAQIGFYDTHTPYAWNHAKPFDNRGVLLPPPVEDTAENRQQAAAFQGAIRCMDAAIGRILQALDHAGRSESTLVIYTSDHGAELPMGKWTLYDNGIRVSLLMRWPNGGIRGGQVRNRLVSNVDLVPTLFDLLDAQPPTNLEGISFADSVTSGDNTPTTRKAIFAMMHAHDRWVESRCVRTATHKLIRNFSPSRFPPIKGLRGYRPLDERPVLELYDLTSDPHELNNLAQPSNPPAPCETLNRQLWDWMHAVGDPLLDGPVVTPYYRAAMTGGHA